MPPGRISNKTGKHPMPKAKAKPIGTTPRAPQHMKPCALMPSVADLGRHLAAQWSAHDLFDEAEGHKEASASTVRKATVGKANAWASILALGDLIMAGPVETPADALVVALQGYCVADMEVNSAGGEASGLLTELRQMRHAFAGIAMALGRAGAGDLRALTGGADIDLMTLHAGAGGAV